MALVWRWPCAFQQILLSQLCSQVFAPSPDILKIRTGEQCPEHVANRLAVRIRWILGRVRFVAMNGGAIAIGICREGRVTMQAHLFERLFFRASDGRRGALQKSRAELLFFS